MKKITKITVTTIIIIIFVGGLFVVLYPFKIAGDTYKTNNIDFSTHIMGLKIRDPYTRAKNVVLFSNQYGLPYIDTARTTWKYEPDADVNDYYDFGTTCYGTNLQPVSDVDAPYGWTYGVQDNFNKWCDENYWYAPTGFIIDPDAKYSGIPDLSMSIATMYPSDSNGNPDDSYSYKKISRTLVDSEGNSRKFELGIGFITMEVTTTIESDQYHTQLTEKTIGDLVCESPGWHDALWGHYQTFGASIYYDVVFRVQLHSLTFEDDFALNPEWINTGNGFLTIHKRGYGIVTTIDEKEFLVATQNTDGWEPLEGTNDIESLSVAQLDRFSSKENAIDYTNKLPADDSTNTYVDFKESTPSVAYFTIHNSATLGMNWENNLLGTTLIDSLSIQKLAWVQRVTIQFYTSACEPLGGSGLDPIVFVVDIPDPPPPKERLWDKLINWVMEISGLNYKQAETLVIAIIVLFCIIVAGVVLAIVAPGIYPLIGKAIAGMFRRMRRTRG